MNPTYLKGDPYTFLEKAPSFIKELIEKEVPENKATELGTKYGITIDNYTALSNVITFILIGAIEPQNLKQALKELVELDETTSSSIEKDLNDSLFKKVQETTLGKVSEKETVVTLTFKKEEGGVKTEELRKELLDTTKREPEKPKIPEKKQAPKGPPSPQSGSRNQLLEQLQLLGSIPNDEEVESRLKKIQEQMQGIEEKVETITTEEGETKVITKKVQVYDFGEDADKTITAVKKAATYSKAPTSYNVDPYREITD